MLCGIGTDDGCTAICHSGSHFCFMSGNQPLCLFDFLHQRRRIFLRLHHILLEELGRNSLGVSFGCLCNLYAPGKYKAAFGRNGIAVFLTQKKEQ